MTMAKKWQWAGVSLLAMLACVRCGVPVCAFGAGDCAKMYANAPGQNQTGGTLSNNPVILESKPSAPGVGQTVQVTPSGGQPCAGNTYNFSYSASNGGTTNADTNNRGAYIFKSPGTYVVTAADCGRPAQQNTINIVVK